MSVSSLHKNQITFLSELFLSYAILRSSLVTYLLIFFVDKFMSFNCLINVASFLVAYKLIDLSVNTSDNVFAIINGGSLRVERPQNIVQKEVPSLLNTVLCLTQRYTHSAQFFVTINI